MIYTSLNKIRKHSPCDSSWEKLLAGLNKAAADDELLPLVTILKINGLSDALWALRTTDCDRESRLLAVAYARQVQHLMTDERSVSCLEVAERFANGQATREELIEARVAAEAAWKAEWATGSAAYDVELAVAYAAGAAAANAAVNAAVNAARAAAHSAKLAAAYTAEVAAWAAMREKQVEIFREIFG